MTTRFTTALAGTLVLAASALPVAAQNEQGVTREARPGLTATTVHINQKLTAQVNGGTAIVRRPTDRIGRVVVYELEGDLNRTVTSWGSSTRTFVPHFLVSSRVSGAQTQVFRGLWDSELSHQEADRYRYSHIRDQYDLVERGDDSYLAVAVQYPAGGRITSAQRRTLVKLLRHLCQRYGVPRALDMRNSGWEGRGTAGIHNPAGWAPDSRLYGPDALVAHLNGLPEAHLAIPELETVNSGSTSFLATRTATIHPTLSHLKMSDYDAALLGGRSHNSASVIWYLQRRVWRDGRWVWTNEKAAIVNVTLFESNRLRIDLPAQGQYRVLVRAKNGYDAVYAQPVVTDTFWYYR